MLIYIKVVLSPSRLYSFIGLYVLYFRSEYTHLTEHAADVVDETILPLSMKVTVSLKSCMSS